MTVALRGTQVTGSGREKERGFREISDSLKRRKGKSWKIRIERRLKPNYRGLGCHDEAFGLCFVGKGVTYPELCACVRVLTSPPQCRVGRVGKTTPLSRKPSRNLQEVAARACFPFPLAHGEFAESKQGPILFTFVSPVMYFT